MHQKKGKKTKKGDWDQVPIGEEFLSEKEMQNLISLEVLTDYEIVTKPNGLTEIVTAVDKQGKVQKRKFAEADIEDDDDEDPAGANEELQASLPLQKKTAKKQKLLETKKNKNSEINNNVKPTNNSNTIVPSATSSWKVSQSPSATVVQSKTKTAIAANTKLKKKPAKKSKNLKPSLDNDELKQSPVEETETEDTSMNEWIKAGVGDSILKSLKEAKFYKPTQIQALTLPASIFGKKDVVGAAETGSGKTLAFAIPIIQGILQSEGNEEESLQALILTPTRELAVQIKKHFDVAAKYTKIKSVVIVGGLATQKQERLLRAKPQVVIATPGRLWELTKQGEQHLANLDKVKYLAVDETDRMVEKGHFQELQGILGLLNLNEEQKLHRQNFVFSATLAFTHDPPKRLNTKKHKQQPKKVSGKEKLKQIMDMIGVRQNPKVVDITSTKGTCETLQEMQINCPSNKKDYYMYYFLIKHPGRTIVFCNSINTVRRLTNLFFLLNCGQVLPLHSEMHQKMRLKNLEKFASDEKSVLIATDVAARGLDIVDIQHVVHYEIPKTAESYIHRSGRTARAFKGGIAIVLVEPSEIGKLKNIFRSLNRDPDKMLPLFNIDATVFRQLKARVDEADKVEKFEHNVRKKLADMNWMDKAKKEMDIGTSDDDTDMDDDSGDGEKRHRKNLLEAKKKLDGYKRTLNKLLSDNSFMSRLGLET